MPENYFLYIGAALSFGGLIVAIPVGIIVAVKEKWKGFRYGAFFLSSSTVLVPFGCLAMIAYAYEFLGVSLGNVIAIPSLMVLIGILIAYKLLPFRSRALFFVVTIPYIFSMYFIPVAIWNVIYILWIAKPNVPVTPSIRTV